MWLCIGNSWGTFFLHTCNVVLSDVEHSCLPGSLYLWRIEKKMLSGVILKLGGGGIPVCLLPPLTTYECSSEERKAIKMNPARILKTGGFKLSV